MSEKIIVGIDPSFRRVGLAFITSELRLGLSHPNWCLTTDSVAGEIKEKNFRGMLTASNTVACEVVKKFNKISSWECLGLDKLGIVLMETPPPIGQFAAGLYMLDTVLYRSLMEGLLYVDIKLLNAGITQSLRGCRSNKTEIVEYFREVIKANPEIAWEEKRICHDEAEAALFALLGFHLFEHSINIVGGNPERWVLSTLK